MFEIVVYAQEKSTYAFMLPYKELDPQGAEIISDYFFAKSCGKKTVNDYTVEEIREFMTKNNIYAKLISLKMLGNKTEYSKILDKLLR